MSGESPSVESVVAMIDSMVTSSGGKLRLDSFDPISKTLRATYEVKKSRDCEICTFDPVHVEALLREVLSTHGVDVSEVLVTTIQV